MSKRPSQPLLDAHQRRRIVTHGMVDPDTGEVISPQTAQLQIPPRKTRINCYNRQCAALLSPFYTAVDNWR